MSKNQSNEQTLSKKSTISSIDRIRDIYVMCFCGIMGSLSVILSFVATIKIGPYIRVGFSGIPNQIVSYLFGPGLGAIFGGAMDIIKWFVNGDGDFFIGYTITAVLAAIIYGLFTYKKPVSIVRIVIAQLLVKVFCNLCLNTIWTSILYGKSIAVILPGRILSNAIMLPIDSAIMYSILLVVSQVIKPFFDNQRTSRPSDKTAN